MRRNGRVIRDGLARIDVGVQGHVRLLVGEGQVWYRYYDMDWDGGEEERIRLIPLLTTWGFCGTFLEHRDCVRLLFCGDIKLP